MGVTGLVGIFTLLLPQFVWSQSFDVYCRINIKEKMSVEKRESVCLCIDGNFKNLFSAEERLWVIDKGKSGMRKRRWGSAVREKILLDLELEVFKNCTLNYKYKHTHEDLGVPDQTDI